MIFLLLFIFVTSYPPDGWTCSVEDWDDHENCYCNCGAWDPDCEDLDLALEAIGCYEGDLCVLDAGDIEFFCQKIPDEWTCNESYYNDSTICDCDCGAWDPDCTIDIADSQSYVLEGCEVGEACIYPEAVCEAVPKKWICNPIFYASGDGCNCECGVIDPDCEFDGMEVFNCLEEEKCINGKCTGKKEDDSADWVECALGDCMDFKDD